jgi:RimJ/RimL family protein N-acetyltransferase
MRTELLTKRLLLRGFRESDWRAMHDIVADERVTRYIPARASTEQEMREWVRYLAHAHQARPPRHDFAITLRSQDTLSAGALIGSCWLSVQNDEPRQADLGYVLNYPYWGRGYATEAARAVLGYGFRELALHRVTATSRPANVASWRVMEKLGMRREGHLVQHRHIKGYWQDSYLYAILEHEWQALER